MTAALKLIESSRTKRWPEHRIISGCVRIATIIAANNAAFKVDPTGNNNFAETLAGPLWDERTALIGTLTSLEAKTPAAIAAKAQLAISILDDGRHSQVREDVVEYCRSLARDVRAFMEDLVQEGP
jgi:hypothetical protein